MKKIISKINKKTVAIIVSIALAAIALFTSTYSLFYGESVAANPDEYSTGVLAITAKSKSDNVNLDNAIPMSDEDGANTDPYIFTIKNVGNVDYKFDIKLLSTGSSNIINSNYIKLKVDDGSVTTLSSLTNSIIKSDVILKAQESLDISLRVWLASDTPNSEIGKTFNSKIVANGQAIYTESNYDATGANKIVSLFNKTGTVTSNSISYDVDSTNKLIKDKLGNTRFYSQSPSNYIDIGDNELWRIIGVFDNKLKVIRNSSIGGYSWDTTEESLNNGGGVNEWSQADAMKLLNPGYNSEIVGGSLWYNSGIGNCYNKSKLTIVHCDFSSTGLNDSVKDKIADVIWYTGGGSISAVYPNDLLSYERGSQVITNNVIVTRTTSWQGKIALPYPSDYAYATDLLQCTETLNHYSSSTCRSNNWMWYLLTGAPTGSASSANYAWFLTPDSEHYTRAYRITASGDLTVYNNTTDYILSAPLQIFPTMFLNSSINIVTGTGTLEDPYLTT